jgi:hypothetical protein
MKTKPGYSKEGGQERVLLAAQTRSTRKEDDNSTKKRINTGEGKLKRPTFNLTVYYDSQSISIIVSHHFYLDTYRHKHYL